jgi:ParB-like chromosome segregation protein Spo0J
MLPRVIQIVHAAGLDARTANTTDPGPAMADVGVIHNIFRVHYADGADQEILDVIDMFHYAMRGLAFVAQLPRRSLTALGFLPRRSRAPRIRPEDVTRLEAAASRFADAEELIEMRFAELRQRQAQQFADNTGQLVELAERLDFFERVIAERRPINHLNAPGENDVITPV